MALAPNLNYNTTFFTAEWRINGFWNRLLHQVAENVLGMNGLWQISPEALPNFGDTNGCKADLLVSKISPLDWSIQHRDPIHSLRGERRRWTGLDADPGAGRILVH
jgi:hypothetical protein